MTTTTEQTKRTATCTMCGREMRHLKNGRLAAHDRAPDADAPQGVPGNRVGRNGKIRCFGVAR